MESPEEAKAPNKECVKVAVNVRPLITTELLIGCTDCVTVVPGEPQVQIGSHAFTFDHVYGSSGSPYSIFKECVLPLIDALFHGYNATVLAYGQTGSGKTYTMGTNYTGEGNCGGIIPEVMDTIFTKIDALKDRTEFLVRVSFIEIFKEEVFDLLDPQSHAAMRTEVASIAKPTLSRAPIQIRETAAGGITLAGVTEAEVRSKEEMASYLTRGSISRATGSTNMNSQSSRSHAIFTIYMEQKNVSHESHGGMVNNEAAGDDILFAKFHLVDLAGSERAKRTGADGLRLKEGIHINRGLLALGNVISALGDERKRKEGGHVPYRDSKLTRLLQDSLGGNSKTVMIACISPADSNAEETINTLKYANRARNIQNKAMINRDPVAAEMQRMRSQLEQLQSELLFCRGGGAPLEELQLLQHKISLLEASNAELRQELKERQVTCELLRQSALDAQVEKDKLTLKIESARGGKSWDEIDKMEKNKELDLVKGYISKIQELEAELLRVQSFSHPCRNLTIDADIDDMASGCDEKTLDVSIEAEEEEKEREHSMLQDQLDKEIQELDKRLEQKEAEMKQFTRVDTTVLKQHYEKKLLELEQEKKLLTKEIEHLRFNLSNMSSTTDESAQKLREDYLQKLNMLETQVSELKKKQEAQAQLLRQKQKSDEAAKRLQEEIQRIKSQKVQLQHKMKQESEQFRSWKVSREKEVLQLKKEGRRNEYEMHKLLALNQRQKMVLQRKTEEAALATKRLKELLEAKKSTREASAIGNANGPGIQVLVHAIEHELEVTLRVHEVRSEYERQMKERAAMAKEVAKLKEESETLKQKIISDSPQTMSPSARDSRIVALENMLKTSSTALVSMASQLSEAEERERVFSGKGRWNQVRSLADAKNLMNYLFNLASSSRCELRDKEVSCREKDSEVAELKDKVVKLNILKRQLEEQLLAAHNQNMQILSIKNVKKTTGISGTDIGVSKEDKLSDVIHKNPQSIRYSGHGVNNLDDMDISDTEMSDVFETDAEASEEFESDVADEDWIESRKKIRKKQFQNYQNRKSTLEDNIPVGNLSEKPNEEGKIKVEKVGFEHCCSCSRVSSCKTKRCECRALGSVCSTYCGCVPSKCSNREGGLINSDMDEISNSEAAESGGSLSSFDHVDDDTSKLVSEGTLLLQSALSKNTTEEKNVKSRKPLSDIGNNVINPNAAKQGRRKKWRKSTIQLVLTEPLQSSFPQDNEASRSREDVPLRLPRAMDSTHPENNHPPLGNRNSARAGESVNGNKEVRGIIPPRSPVRMRKASDEKENHMA
uniref:Kinesin motor domain-containing protein n=1 Tax=Musa acuminata subsp. malaccensis TaxID=214687 RepID=A0A804J8S7_MUSAM|nr:PREDICTED: kinesin-like protein KIN-4C isoform X1 [Musa acuminata subsp. malaccensis]